MKRVLVITYYWPPSGGSGVQRWVKFARYLPAEGWQPVIYTPSNPELTAVDETLAAEVPDGVEVIRRPIREPYALYRRVMGKDSSTDMKTLVTPISSTGRKGFKQRLSLFVRGNCFVPDPRVGWVRPSVRFLSMYLKEHPVDVIVTTGPPQSVHLIGQRLARKTGLPWIPDFRDPWTKMYYLRHLGMTRGTWKRLYRMEQSVLDEATRVLTVTPVVREEYQARTKTPVAMITNGFDPADFSAPEPRDGFFNLTHTGLLASDGNPLVLWKVLGGLAASDPDFRAALRIRLAGKTDREVLEAIASAGLDGQLVNAGYLDHAAAVREQQQAEILLLPLRNDPEYFRILPGKLFEYLAARRPILGIGQTDGAMARVLSDARAGEMFSWYDEAGLRGFLERAWERFRSTGIPPTSGPIDRYTRQQLTRELAALLDSVLPDTAGQG